MIIGFKVDNYVFFFHFDSYISHTISSGLSNFFYNLSKLHQTAQIFILIFYLLIKHINIPIIILILHQGQKVALGEQGLPKMIWYVNVGLMEAPILIPLNFNNKKC